MIEMFSVHRATILNPCGQKPKKIVEFVPGDEILCVSERGTIQKTEVVALHDHGLVEGFKATFDDGYQIICSAPHRFLTPCGMVSLGDIALTGLGVLSNGTSTQTRRIQGGCRKQSTPPTDGSGAGRDAKSRSIKTPGCDIDQASYDLFLLGNWSDATGLAGVAYSDAPLTSTGDLVLRRIVRVRFVGLVHMYDLEVAHPKHNFLLPNGVVTSNCETSIHFFPGYKRKLYRANKHLREFSGAVDVEILAEMVNKDLNLSGLQTTGVELADLMGAAANSVQGEVDDENSLGMSPLNRAAASSDWQPDIRAEHRETRRLLSEGIPRLDILEQKLLKMKGINLAEI